MKLYDAHTHLNEPSLFANWKWHIQDFKTAGGKWMILSGADEEYNDNALEICSSFSDDDMFLKCTLGFHPYEAIIGTITKQNISEKITELDQKISENLEYIVAIGECWIDLHYPNSDETLEIQQLLFIEQIKLAKKYKLPLVIHARDAFAQTLEIIQDYPGLKIHFHCRSYTPVEAQKLIKSFPGLYIGVCGNVSYKKAIDIQESLEVIPHNRLLIETDAPYLSPQEVRWEKNTPVNCKYIYNFIAEYLHLGVDNFANQIEKNFQAMYNKN